MKHEIKVEFNNELIDSCMFIRIKDPELENAYQIMKLTLQDDKIAMLPILLTVLHDYIGRICNIIGDDFENMLEYIKNVEKNYPIMEESGLSLDCTECDYNMCEDCPIWHGELKDEISED